MKNFLIKVIGTVLLLNLGLYSADLNIITDRSDFHLKDLVKDFENQTSKKVNITFVKEGIIERAQNGKFDIMITKDSSELIAAKRIGMLKPLPVSVSTLVPNQYKDIKDAKWFIVSYRIRAFHVKNTVTDIPLTWTDLAKPQYKGRICTRSATHNYNLELYGTLLSDMGEEKFKEWFTAFKDNLARTPVGNDRNQVKAVYEGICDIAIANTYYRGVMLEDPEQRAWAENTILIIPDQGKNQNGAIALFAGIGSLTTNALNEDFYKFMLSDTTQKGLSKHNYEYPLSVKNTNPMVYEFGSSQGLNYDTIKLHKNIQNELFDLRKKVYFIVK